MWRSQPEMLARWCKPDADATADCTTRHSGMGDYLWPADSGQDRHRAVWDLGWAALKEPE